MTNQEKTMSGPTKKCPYCQTDIPAKAKKCPHCQADLRNFFERHSTLTLLGFILLFFYIVGLGIDTSSLSSSQALKEQSTPSVNEELLELVSLRCYNTGETSPLYYFHITGEVKNISNKPLKGVRAVGTAYTEDGKFVKSDTALIEYNPILLDILRVLK